MEQPNASATPPSPMPIGAAVELLQKDFPDISHSSLRFLEREGLISSSRTSGGHRLYSRDDLERVARIKTWQRAGLSLQEIRGRLELRESLQDSSRLALDFLQLVLSQEFERAQRLILDADRAGVPPRTLFLDVLQPVLVAVGHQWASGEIEVFQEKEISEVCRELVVEITLRHAPDFATGPVMIAACVAGERHEIGLRMICGLVRQAGCRVRYLGVDVAADFLAGAVEANRPDAVLLSSSLDESFAGCAAAVAAVQKNWPLARSPPIFVGGEMAERREAEIVALGAIPVTNVDVLLRAIESIDPAI